MEFKKKILTNGLAVVGEVNRSAKSAAVGFFVRTGARDENSAISGVSHFLEHMLFKGTEKLSALEVNEAFDRTGAQFNASTSEENTVFYAAVLPEYLLEVTELWAELMRAALRDEDFNIEKNVIKEEIAMYKDIPSWDVIDRCKNLYFDGHPCGNSVLGSEESIDGLAAEQMRGYFASRYAPNNMVLAVAGNFDWDEICAAVEDRCGGWQNQDVVRELRECKGSKGQLRVERVNLAREHVCLMSPAVSFQDPRRYAAGLLAMIIGDGVGSRFFWELVDKALAETAVMHFDPMDGTGSFYSYISCGSDNVCKVIDIIKGIFAELVKNSVTEEELRKAKNKILSAMVIENEVPMGRLANLGLGWIYSGRYYTIEEDVNAVKAVTVADIGLLIDEFKPGDFTQLALGPLKSG